jgi:hypothetical protein
MRAALSLVTPASKHKERCTIFLTREGQTILFTGKTREKEGKLNGKKLKKKYSKRKQENDGKEEQTRGGGGVKGD